MNFYIKTMKDWWKLAKPSKKYYFLIFFFVVLTQVCLIIAPIFSAKVTISITNRKYTDTILYLVLVFGFLFLRKFFWHCEYLMYAPYVKHTYNRINNEFVNKAFRARSSNFKTTSKEQLLNRVHTDIFTVAEFGEKTSIALARFVMTIVNIIVIFTVNVWAGLIVVVADILDFIMLAWASNRRQRWHKLIRQSHDQQYEKFSEIIDAREAITDLGVEKRVKAEYNEILDTYIKRLHKRDFWDSIYANGYAVFYEFLILAATIMSVILVSHHSLTIETYFIVVSYVSNGIANTKDMFSVIKEFNNVNTAAARVKTVLDFVERDEVTIGKNTLTDIMGNLCFSDVTYKKDDEGNPSLKNFDILFNENQTCLILGTRSCGKRTIFNMLRRAIEPDEGQITLSGVNLYDFTTKSYLENFSYVTTHPTFFKGSIMKNLQIKEKNKKVIHQICRELGIHDHIMSLPKKYNTDISTLAYDKLYLIGLARAILTGSQVLAIYEFPDALTEKEKKKVKQILHAMHGTRTILIFSAKDYCQDISDKIITIEKGLITNIAYTENNKADII